MGGRDSPRQGSLKRSAPLLGWFSPGWTIIYLRWTFPGTLLDLLISSKKAFVNIVPGPWHPINAPLWACVCALCDVGKAIGLPWWLSGKKSTCQRRRLGFDPWVGKIPWRRAWQTHSSTLSWRIPMDRRAWWAIFHGVAKSQTWRSN